MKNLFLFVLVAFAISACNTVHGVGKDLEKGGEVIQDSAK